DVLQGIEADAPKSPCRFIAKKMGDEAMRRFMKGDGDNYWDHPNGRQVEHIRQAAVLRARLPYLLRSEATRFKKRRPEAKVRWIGNRGGMDKPGVCGRVAE